MNGGYRYSEHIDPRSQGWTLLRHMEQRHAHGSESQWRERIEAGQVLVDGAPAGVGVRLAPGQIVEWLRPPWEEPEVPLYYEVLFEDGDLLAVGKPSGLPTLPRGGYYEHTLLMLVRQRYPEASPAHRLGRGTSGVVLFARTPAMGGLLCAALRDRRLAKVYLALAEGRVSPACFSVETPIGPVPHPKLGSVYAACPGGKPSRSHVRVREVRDDGTSLVEVRIETGRPHQIRIHMAASGYPLVGDPLYGIGGGIRPGTLALPGDEGYRLHAWRVELIHPGTGQPLEVVSPPPEALKPIS